jgi:hypothetical protein
MAAGGRGGGGIGGGGMAAGGRAAPGGVMGRGSASGPGRFASGRGTRGYAYAPNVGRNYAYAPNVRRNYVAPGGTTAWTRDGRRFHRRNFRGPAFAFGFGGYGYDYYAYNDTCWRLRLIGGVWRRVWVCETAYPYY